MSSIGTLKEGSLHRHLKFRYSQLGKTEVPVGDYVCDVQTGDGELIEVQTGSFGPLKEKIARLSKNKKIKIIYPVIICKYIELYDVDGKLLRKRKSPKKGSAWDLFKALLYAPELPLNPMVKIELVFLDITEKRKNDGKGSWRRKGVTIEDRVPVSWRQSIVLNELNDYNLFIPIQGETFTVKDLCDRTGIRKELSQKCLYVLNKMKIIEQAGKKGNAYIYKKRGVQDQS